MADFLFALDAMLPTVCILLCGCGLRRCGILTEAFLRQGDRLCFLVLFPLLVFWNLYDGRAYLEQGGQVGMAIGFAYGVIALSLLVGTVVLPRFVRDRRRLPVIAQAFYRGNFMLYGLPFSELLGGQASLVVATTMSAATLPVLNMAAIFQFATFTGGGGQPWRRVAVRTLQNPIIWGVLLGILFQRMDWVLPAAMETAVSDLAGIATPLAFLFLGGQFHGLPELRTARTLLPLLAVKLLLLPLLGLSVCIFALHMGRTELIPAFIFLAAPTAITTYQLAVQYEADARLAADVTVYSLLFSVCSLFLWIYLLRVGGWI